MPDRASRDGTDGIEDEGIDERIALDNALLTEVIVEVDEISYSQ